MPLARVDIVVRSAGSDAILAARAFVASLPKTGIRQGSRPYHPQFSLFISFDLLTIPPPTTASPFRHDRFDTLLHRRGLPRLSPRQTYPVGGILPLRGQGFEHH